MAKNLLAAFEGMPEGSVLTLEIREFGLWVVCEETGIRLFLGSMQPPAGAAPKH